MFRSISMPEFYQETKRNALNVVDVRETYEYEMGHVPEAVNLPLSELGERFTELEKGKEYYIICQSGARSQTACQFLAAQGHDVINVMGGTSAWMGDLA